MPEPASDAGIRTVTVPTRSVTRSGTSHAPEANGSVRSRER